MVRAMTNHDWAKVRADFPILEEQVNGATEAFTEARQVLLNLQAHEPKTFAVWQRIADVTMAVCLSVCERLHVNCTAEHSAGESTYAAELAPMVAELDAKGLLVDDQGARIIRVAKEGDKRELPPLLVVSSEGSAMYGTTDLATTPLEEPSATGFTISGHFSNCLSRRSLPVSAIGDIRIFRSSLV